MTAIDSRIPKQGVQVVATAYYGCGGDSSIVQHIHLKWDSAFVGVFTFETSDLLGLDPTAAGAAGDWIQENPTTAYIGISPAGAGSVANMTVTVAGGTAGGASVHVGNLGSRLLRVKVVCTTQGVIVISSAGKE